ncbi:DegT/DnrJ/EryC1/StrS family aminotransferase [Spirochaeta africana]|uniref:Putative PLP-dependent enzyme possibly involved in cell wall biogenesis n=1 Tax=Spirochaeta africana (strain ATCC 700263 / DSM 8902 / Z-7692) TaxID=889378 RepID=H9UF48_SPIAZ|nr:DegT/DnrJ/EryC1/StrS family aminotransferase [Spirochaeta africana]AFG36141.1 putative PLP-dependent enzyme possibly involved in cell wall biogenesis [Spirochaeta africana DSM 8902]
MIPVTRPYLPSKRKLKKYIDRIYKTGWLTNNGPLVQELENRLQEYLGVRNVVLVANGSLALQVAYKALDLQGEVITTPFSFAATSSTLVWEGLQPVFADIDPETFNLNPDNIEPLVTENTSAILPVHVYGNPCEVERIREIADRHNLKVIYDAAHAFGVQYKGSSVLNRGDISTLSFHATKVFHTVEGGAIITADDALAQRVRKLINFGIYGPDRIDGVGTNAKMNEFEAAMGLCVLDDMPKILDARRKIWEVYERELSGRYQLMRWNRHATRNYAYAPIVTDAENHLTDLLHRFHQKKIFPRRYFYPSLDTVAEYSMEPDILCAQARSLAARVMCLPIYAGIRLSEQKKILAETEMNP